MPFQLAHSPYQVSIPTELKHVTKRTTLVTASGAATSNVRFLTCSMFELLSVEDVPIQALVQSSLEQDVIEACRRRMIGPRWNCFDSRVIKEAASKT